jgi:hypothetical protein
VIPGTQAEVKVRVYSSDKGTYVGVAYRGYTAKTFTVKIPLEGKESPTITDLVTGKPVQYRAAGGEAEFDVPSGPVELNAYLVK